MPLRFPMFNNHQLGQLQLKFNNLSSLEQLRSKQHKKELREKAELNTSLMKSQSLNTKKLLELSMSQKKEKLLTITQLSTKLSTFHKFTKIDM